MENPGANAREVLDILKKETARRAEPVVVEPKVGFQEVRSELKYVSDEKTTPEAREKSVGRLNEVGVVLPDINDQLERLKLSGAVEVASKGSVKERDRWGSVEEAKNYLSKMGVDFGDGRATEPRIERREVELRGVLVDRPVEPENGRRELSMEELFDIYEDHYNERFLRSWDTTALPADDVTDRIDSINLLEVSGYNPDKIQEWQNIIDGRAPGDDLEALKEMFEAAQEVYLNYVLGPGVLSSFDSKAKGINLLRTIGGKEPTKDLSVLSNLIASNSVRVGMSRDWSEENIRNLADFLGQKFNIKEKAETIEEKTSKFYLTLNEGYAMTNDLTKDVGFQTRVGKIIEEIKADEIKKGGSSVLAEKLRVEFLAVSYIHDFRINTDRRSAVDDGYVELAGQMDGYLSNLLHLRNPDNGNNSVIDYLVEFDRVARNRINANPKEFFNLNDPSVAAEVLSSSNNGVLSEFYMKIAKDIYRVTGGDSRYAVAKDYIVEEGKGSYAAPKDSFNGGALRSLIHFRKAQCGDAKKNTLIRHLDLGVTSYWEMIMGRPTFGPNTARDNDWNPAYAKNFAILDRRSLSDAVFDVSGIGDLSYTKWITTMKAANDAKSAESKFMGNPSIKSWIANLSSAYFYDAYGRKGTAFEKRAPYLQARLSDLVGFLVASKENPITIAKDLDEVLTTGLMDQTTLESFKKTNGIAVGVQQVGATTARAISNIRGDNGPKNKAATVKAVAGMGKDLIGLAKTLGDIFGPGK